MELLVLTSVMYLVYILEASAFQSIFENIKEVPCKNEINYVTNLLFEDRWCNTVLDASFTYSDYDFTYTGIKQARIVLKLNETEVETYSTLKVAPGISYIFDIIPSLHQENYESLVMFVPTANTLHKLSSQLFTSPKSRFLIVFTYSEQTYKEIEQVLDVIWQTFRTPYVTAITTNCSVLSYNPFISKSGKMGVLNQYTYEEIKSNSDLVVANYRTLNSYPMKTIVFASLMARKIFENETFVDYGGIDGWMLDILSKYMNFEKIILKGIPMCYYGHRCKNGTFDGSLKYILDGKVEFIFVSYFLKDYYTNDIEFSSVALQDQLCILVRKAEDIPILVLFFSYHRVWLLLIFSYTAIAAAWMLILKCETKLTNRNNSNFLLYLNTFRLVLANPFPRKAVTFSERFFLLCCMLAILTFSVDLQGI